MKIKRYSTPKELSHAAAELFCERVSGKKAFSVALSGGSTPKALYYLLSSSVYRDKIDWTQIEFFWGDERGVPPEHYDSNFRMANEVMLSALPVPENRIHRFEAERADVKNVISEYETQLVEILGDPPAFDLILLGMGSDGHTASLFPHSPALDEKTRWVTLNPHGQLGGHRFTLTYPTLNQAKEVVFLVSGKAKANALQMVLEGEQDPKEYPAQGVSGNILWMIDEDAATQLENKGELVQ